MRLYQPAQFASILVFIVVAGTVVPICPSGGNDIALPADKKPARFTTEVTAYSTSPDETWGDPFITASGRRVHDGLVACPRRYPFGTRFRIGSDIYTCWDRLHVRFDHRLDIWKPSKQEALRFGKRVLVIDVL